MAVLMRARGLNVPSGTCAPPAGVLGLVPWISLTRTIPAHAVLVSAGTWLWLLCIRLVTTGRRHEASRFGAAMKVFLLLLVLLFALVVGVLAWGAYETLRATVEGRLRPRTVLALLRSVSFYCSFWSGLGIWITGGRYQMPSPVQTRQR